MFRSVIVIVSALAFVLPTVSYAQTVKEIVEKAIEAHGGAAKLKKLTAGKAISKATMNYMGLEVAIDAVTTFQMPEQFRNELTMEILGKKIVVTQIYNMGKTKITANTPTPPVSDEQKAELQQSVNLQKIQQLLPLLDPKQFELSVIEKAEKIGDRELVGLLAKDKDKREIKVFFDKKTYLIAKIERRGLDPIEKEVDQVIIYTGYKKFDGLNYPVKSEVLLDGKKFLTAEVVELEHLEKIDPKVFDVAD